MLTKPLSQRPRDRGQRNRKAAARCSVHPTGRTVIDFCLCTCDTTLLANTFAVHSVDGVSISNGGGVFLTALCIFTATIVRYSVCLSVCLCLSVSVSVSVSVSLSLSLSLSLSVRARVCALVWADSLLWSQCPRENPAAMDSRH